MPVWFVFRGAGGWWGRSTVERGRRCASSSAEIPKISSFFSRKGSGRKRLSLQISVPVCAGSRVRAAVALAGWEMVLLLCYPHRVLLFRGWCVHEITAHKPSIPGWRAHAYLTILNENIFLIFTLKFYVSNPAAIPCLLFKQACLLFCIF